MGNKIHNNWYKFLISEVRQEKEMVGLDGEKIIQKIKTNDFFRSRFMDDALKLVIIPSLKKSFSMEEIKSILKEINENKNIIESEAASTIIGNFENTLLDYEKGWVVDVNDPSGGYFKRTYFDEIKETLTKVMGSNYIGPKSDLETFVIYSLYFMIFKNLPSFSFTFINPFLVEQFYKGMYGAETSVSYENPYGGGVPSAQQKQIPLGSAPTSPIIKRLGKETESDYVGKNINTLQKAGIYLNPNDLKEIPILSKFMIGKRIGSGAFGQVFDLIGTNYVVKIFSDSMNMFSDIHRYKTMEDKVFGGRASIKDMHYLENGEIGEDYYSKVIRYYVIMPHIIPLTSTDFYKNNPGLYEELFNLLRDAVFDEGYDFEDDVYDYIKASSDKIIKTFPDDFIFRVIDAYLRAVDEHGGGDLHGGNIGFLEARPDVFFYFDM